MNVTPDKAGADLAALIAQEPRLAGGQRGMTRGLPPDRNPLRRTGDRAEVAVATALV